LFRAGGFQFISAEYWVGQTSMAIATTGSNWAVGILTGYGHVKSHPSTMSLCPVVMSYGSLVMSGNMARA